MLNYVANGLASITVSSNVGRVKKSTMKTYDEHNEHIYSFPEEQRCFIERLTAYIAVWFRYKYDLAYRL